MTKTVGYFSNYRPEVADMLTTKDQRVLDVGCGFGHLGLELRGRDPSRVVMGIELDEYAASKAKENLHCVISGDVDTVDIPLPEKSLDCIIFADVLEHLPEPGNTLQKMGAYLVDGGSIVASIPNVRHYTAISRVVSGWHYDDWGIFDHTHLRFFCLTTMRQLFDDAGYKIERIEPKIVASKKARIVNSLCLGRLEEFVAMQYLIRARKV